MEFGIQVRRCPTISSWSGRHQGWPWTCHRQRYQRQHIWWQNRPVRDQSYPSQIWCLYCGPEKCPRRNAQRYQRWHFRWQLTIHILASGNCCAQNSLWAKLKQKKCCEKNKCLFRRRNTKLLIKIQNREPERGNIIYFFCTFVGFKTALCAPAMMPLRHTTHIVYIIYIYNK